MRLWDPSIRNSNLPAASLIKVVEQKPIERIDDQTLVFADVGRKAIEQVRCAARDMLGGRMPGEAADKLAHKLSQGTWTHDYPISATEAKALGLNVSTDMPSDILDLLALYDQPMRTQASVEYLSGPRQRQVSQGGEGQRASF
jgi:ClpP class serine protease